MTIPSYSDFFHDVHGFEPFPWQAELAKNVIEDGWPAVIPAPTGLGKTSVVDIAVYRLAYDLAVAGPTNRRAHTRIAMVVDRRLIVDATHGHVESIVRALVEAEHESATAWVAEQLVTLGGADQPLVALRMRGGLDWNSLWAERPTQPLVVAGTVDQIGSRMLFRGYGTSERMRPIDAGLLGTDTLVLLDEAHLSGAFAETINGCRALQGRSSVDPTGQRPLTVVEMTATPSQPTETVLTGDDTNHERAAPRLSAEKRARLVDVGDATSKTKAAADAGTVLARLATAALDRDRVNVVLVVANTVDAARAAFEALAKRKVDAALVVGRCRTADRVERLADWMPRVKTGRDRGDVQPLVVVATQTVEVGVDIDVDALVTEVAPIDSLVQRFGRVDRVGELGSTDSWVVRLGPRLADDPPPYGAATRATWDWLTEQAGGADSATIKSGGEDGEAMVDFGSLRMREALHPLGDVTDLLAPSSLPPVVTPSALRVWSRTSPQPEPDEDIAAYLHGVDRGQAIVTFLWRADLARDSDTVTLAVPPGPHEQVELTLAAARRFLGGLSPVDQTDLEAEPEAEARDRLPPRTELAAFVKRDEAWQVVHRPRELRPGDVVVLDANVGGHDSWSFTGIREDDGSPVVDVGDLGPGLAILEQGRYDGQISIRFDEGNLVQLVGRDMTADETRLHCAVADIATEHDVRAAAAINLIRSLRSEIRTDSDYPRAVDALFGAVLDASDRIIVSGGRVRADVAADDDLSSSEAGRLAVGVHVNASADASDEGDRSSMTVSETDEPVRLDAHLASVAERCSEFATRLGLDDDLARAVRLAGRFHDLGKADVRFQGMLTGGPRWMAEALGSDIREMVAKSRQRTRNERNRARELAGWPMRYRHEAVSLALVESAPAEAFDGADRELVEHLVASHHGCGRPLFPAVVDADPVDVKVEIDGVVMNASSEASHPGWSQPDRFHRLCERYGPWGLAWLEAIVRLADISISKEGR